MGITLNSAAVLLKAREQGASFRRTLTLGRLDLHLKPAQAQRLSRRFKTQVATAANTPVNDFLHRNLAAEEVRSLDYSGYEGADIEHDLNTPLDKSLHGQFDAVIDGGTLEHIFNFPTALKSCMEAVAPAGSLFLFTVANNHLGHGFYQFSPELFYRALHPDNGFELDTMVLYEHDYPGAELREGTRCVRVMDPAAIGDRVRLTSKRPAQLLVRAVRVKATPPFADGFPIQSDYAAIYERQTTSAGAAQLTWKQRTARYVLARTPEILRNTFLGQLQLASYSLRNRRYFVPWSPDD